MLRYKVVLVGVWLLAAVCLAACNPLIPTPAPTPLPQNLAPTPVGVATPTTYTVQRGPVRQAVVFRGSVAFARQQNLMFENAGRIVDIYVDNGSLVDAGQPVAGLDSVYEQSDLKLAVLELTLAQEQLARAQVEHRFDELNRKLQLQREQLELEAVKATNPLTSPHVARQEIVVRQAQLALDQLAGGLDPRLAYNLNAAELAVLRAQTAISRTQLVAPVAGEVHFAEILQLGKIIQPSVAAGTVVDPNSLVVDANLAPSDLERLHEGMPVVLRLGTAGSQREAPGTVVRLPQPYGTGTRTVAEFAPSAPADADLLQPASTVEIAAELARVDNALWLPPDAILGFKDHYFVRLPDGSQAPIQVGLFAQDRVEIVEGIDAGAVVVGR